MIAFISIFLIALFRALLTFSLLPPVTKFIVVQPKNMDYVLFPGKS